MRKSILKFLCVGIFTCGVMACGDDSESEDVNVTPKEETEDIDKDEQSEAQDSTQKQNNANDSTQSIIHEFVDLGLTSGTLWAKENIGATNCFEYGHFFAWGETNTKDFYTFDNYKYKGETVMMVSKYCLSEESGPLDNLSNLLSEDDAATALWGEGWTMPTYGQMQEIMKECECVWARDYEGSGINGLLVKSKTNDNSIFLPAAGMFDNKLNYEASECFYATKTVFEFGSYRAWVMDATSIYNNCANINRYNGYSIRPVVNKIQ